MFKNSTTNLALSNFIIALKKDKEILCSSVLTAPCLIHKPGHLDYGGSDMKPSIVCFVQWLKRAPFFLFC